MHVMRNQVIDLVVGEISLLFPGIDQLFYVVVLVFKSQEVSSNSSVRPRGACDTGLKRWVSGVARSCASSTNFQSLAHKCRSVYHFPYKNPRRPPLNLTLPIT